MNRIQSDQLVLDQLKRNLRTTTHQEFDVICDLLDNQLNYPCKVIMDSVSGLDTILKINASPLQMLKGTAGDTTTGSDYVALATVNGEFNSYPESYLDLSDGSVTGAIDISGAPASTTDGYYRWMTISAQSTSGSFYLSFGEEVSGTPDFGIDMPIIPRGNTELTSIRLQNSGGGAWAFLRPSDTDIFNHTRGGGSGASSAVIDQNYIEDYDGVAVGAWTRYANSTSGVTDSDFDFAGSPNANVTWTISDTDPLYGDSSFVLTKDANSRPVEGVYYPFTLEPGDLASLMKTIAAVQTSAAYLDGDVRIYLVLSNDNFSSNIKVIEPNGVELKAGIKDYLNFLQTNAAYNQARLCIHIASTNASAWTVKFDNFFFGKYRNVAGPIGTDWKTSTVVISSWTTNATHVMRYRQQGPDIIVEGSISLSGAPDAVALTIDLPNGLSFDTSSPLANISAPSMGIVSYNDNGVGRGSSGQRVEYVDSNTFRLRDGNAAYSNTVPITWAAGDQINYKFIAPIQGWSSNTTLSDTNSGRLIAAEYRGNGGESLTANVSNTPFATVIYDYTSSWNGTQFTAPESGLYNFKGAVLIDSSISWAADEYIIPVGGSATQGKRIITGGLTSLHRPFDCQTYLRRGEVWSIRPADNITVVNTALQHYIQISKLSSMQTIGALEKIYAIASSNNGQTVLTDSAVIYEDIEENSHGLYNSTTGQFTANVAGVLSVNASILTSNLAWISGDQLTIRVVKNSVRYRDIDRISFGASITNYIYVGGSTDVPVNAGDTISVQLNYARSGGNVSLDSSSYHNYVNFRMMK